MIFENELEIGRGIYTASEIAQILRQPDAKIRRWINTYWDGKLAEEYGEKYSWRTDGSPAVSFHTLVEIYLMLLLGEAGVKPRSVLAAHRELAHWYDTPFPFALRSILEKIRTDGRTIYFELAHDEIVTLDGSKQFNIDFVKIFFQKLEFEAGELATSLWPLGKEKSVVIDPSRQFGHPVIDGSNIYPDTLYNHYLAGDPIAYIAHVYELEEREVHHAIEFCQAA